MPQHIATISYLVDTYDRAIRWFVEVLGFELVEDTPLGPGKRWVVVRPKGQGGAALLLAEASTGEQCAAMGRQAGGRVFLFLRTDDFAADFAAMTARGVRFLEEPRHEAYGSVAVFEDLYGQKWDLLGSRPL